MIFLNVMIIFVFLLIGAAFGWLLVDRKGLFRWLSRPLKADQTSELGATPNGAVDAWQEWHMEWDSPAPAVHIESPLEYKRRINREQVDSWDDQYWALLPGGKPAGKPLQRELVNSDGDTVILRSWGNSEPKPEDPDADPAWVSVNTG